MNAELQQELATAIKSDMPLDQIAAMLRKYKTQGITRDQIYSFLEAWHRTDPNDPTDDRILEVADFVSAFCAPHMKFWGGETPI